LGLRGELRGASSGLKPVMKRIRPSGLTIQSFYGYNMDWRQTMNLKEDIKPISYIKSHTADILEKINRTHRPIIITQNGEARGVFLDTETFEDMKKTISLLKMILQSEAEIDRGETVPQNEVFDRIRDKIKKAREEV
jgi:prevent-host-death family protein